MSHVETWEKNLATKGTKETKTFFYIFVPFVAVGISVAETGQTLIWRKPDE
jgi:hypothetical protein